MLGLLLNSGILAEESFNPLAPVVAVPLFHFKIGSYNIAVDNHMLMIAIATVLLLIIMPIAGRGSSLVPRGFRNLIETICVYIRDEVARPVLGEHTDRYIHYIWTLFFFILTLNLIALIPTEKIILIITGKENHYGGAATADIYVTGSLAALTFIMTHVSGIRQQGFVHYFKNFAPHVPLPMLPFIYFLEIVSAFVKPFALAIRLFANMVAGHTLLATFLGLILVFKLWGVATASIVMVVIFSVMELFVAFLAGVNNPAPIGLLSSLTLNL
jgi:F-type H+-transporting ATPase subunit a